MENLPESEWRVLFSLVSSDAVVKAAVPGLLKLKAKSPQSSWGSLVKHHHLHKFTPSQLKAAVKTLPVSLPPERKFSEFMKRFRLNAEASDAKSVLE